MANGDEETKLKDALLQINTEIYGNGSPFIDANVTYLVKECQKLNLTSKDLLDNRKTIVEEIGKTGKELNYRLKRFGDVFKTVSDEKAAEREREEEEFKENLKDILLEALEDKEKSTLYRNELGRAVRELELQNINLQIIDLGNIIIRDSLILSFEQNINKNFYEVKEALKEKLKTISEAITTPAQNSKPGADAAPYPTPVQSNEPEAGTAPYVGSVSQEQGISPEEKLQVNSSHEKPSITNPFVEGYEESVKKKFREDIAEIIRGARSGLNIADDADNIANSLNLLDINFSKINLQNEDVKNTLVKIIKDNPFLFKIYLSPELKSIELKAISDEKKQMDDPIFTNPFEEQFRKDIAEIIKSVDPKLDANTIVNLINLEGIDLSKIDLKNEDSKKTLTEGVEGRAATYVLSVDEESVAKTLSMDLKHIADQVERIESAFDVFVHERAKQPKQPEQLNVNINPFYSEAPTMTGSNPQQPDHTISTIPTVTPSNNRIPISPDPSRGKLSRDLKQGKGITNAQTKAQKSVQILKNSEIPAIRNVANELSNILEKEDRNTKILENIINESKREDLQKGCLRLYEDIQPFITIDGSKQTELEAKILEKLPKRIKEAKYERKFGFKKVINAIKELVDGAKGGRLTYLKAEFSKLDVAGKILAVAATTAAIAATPIVLGVGLAGTAVVGAAAPLAGAGYVANELKKAYDEEVRNERQELADEKKGVVPNYGEGHEYITDLLKGLIDLAVVHEQLKMLKVAIEQDPKLRGQISKEVLDIIEKSTTTTTDKLWNQGELIKAIEGLGEDAAKKLLTLVENIREPKSEKLSPEEKGYFNALKELITTGLITLIISIFFNKVINTGSKANEAFLSGIDKDKFPDVRDMLKNCSELDKAGGDQLYEALELKILEANQPEEPKLLEVNPSIDTLNIFNMLDKRNPTDNELKLLKDAFNSLDPKDIKELAEESTKLLSQQKAEKRSFSDKVVGAGKKVQSFFTGGTSAQKVEKQKGIESP